jgi:hypothetical protein
MAAWAAHWSNCVAHKKKQEVFSSGDILLEKEMNISKPNIPGGMIDEITELITTMATRATEGVWMPK